MGTDEGLQSLRRQLETHKKNFLRLEEQAATYGIDVPLRLSNQIDHEKEEIARIEKQIAQLKEPRSSFTDAFKAAGPVQAIKRLVEVTRVPGIEAKYWGCNTPRQDANIKLYIEEVDVGLVRLEFIDSEEKTLITIRAELKAEQMALAENWRGELLRLLTKTGYPPSAGSGTMENSLESTEPKKERPRIVSESHSLLQYDYDVAFSFSGEDREYVEQVAEILKKRHIRVFYDKFEEIDLWGRDLYVHLDEVYRLKARYCVMFISKHYASKLWTNHERRSAQARAFQENKEYLLPARFDDTEIPGIRPTLGYVGLRNISPSQLAEKIIAKLEQNSSSATRSSQPADRLRESSAPYSASPQEGRPPSESVASLMREVERIQKIVDHNLQLKLDDTPQLVKKMPVTAFETAFGGGRRLGVSEELLQAVADYLDCAAYINLLVDRYENLIRSGQGTDPRQIGVPGSSLSSHAIQQIQEISKQELSEALEKLRIYLRGESRQAMD
jgi:hypothetical protein